MTGRGGTIPPFWSLAGGGQQGKPVLSVVRLQRLCPGHWLAPLGLLSALLFATGCGGGGGSGPNVGATSQIVAGQAVKGPLRDAVIEILNPEGDVVASGTVHDGTFELSADISPYRYIEVRTRGGYFIDEATEARIEVSPTEGLRAMFSAQDLAERAGRLVLSAETTIVTCMVEWLIQAGSGFDAAMSRATDVYVRQFMGESLPPSVAGHTETVMHFGSPIAPVGLRDALGWQRARAFSHYTRAIGVDAASTFQLMEALALDMRDGLLDGTAGGEAITMPAHPGGPPHDMCEEDHGLRFAQARAGVLHHDLCKVVRGEAPVVLRRHMELMLLDLGPFDMLHQQHDQGISTTPGNLLAENLPEFQHLPVLSDEDGDSQNQAGHYTLRAVADVDVTIRVPGNSWLTPMYRYNALQLPPVIRAERGDEMFLSLVNELTEETTIHWHGAELPGPQDGGPTDPVSPAESRLYRFILDQPSASLWFHPHPHPGTAEQVYRGLAGVLLLSDATERQLRQDGALPTLEHDIPILLQDRLFGNERSGERRLVYSRDHMSGFGMMGAVVLVNGTEVPRLGVDTRQYVFRLYNASNSRTYDIALSDGRSFHVVGSDGGWLPQPVKVDHSVLSAGERIAIVVDFTADTPGDRVMLVSRPFMSGAAMGMLQFRSAEERAGMHMRDGGREHHGGRPYQPGEGCDLMRFDVERLTVDDVQLYERLPSGADVWTRWQEQEATATRSFVMSWSHAPGQFLINGKEYSEHRVDEYVAPGATEIWEIINVSPVPHPFHPHAIQWQVLDRNRSQAGGVERGWKDTVLVLPGESVRLIGRFAPVNTGRYVYHCHILEHEDAGMMGLFEVGP